MIAQDQQGKARIDLPSADNEELAPMAGRWHSRKETLHSADEEVEYIGK